MPTLKLERLKPFAHSLAPDPAHVSKYYLLVETNQEHWLLHIAPATAPTSPLFPRPTLIARVRPSGEREIVVNAVPALSHIQTILQGLHPNLMARPTSIHSLCSAVAGSEFAALLAQHPKRSKVLPEVRATEVTWQPYLDLLISNWRDGFIAILDQLREPPTAEMAEPFSRFSLIVDDLKDVRFIANFDQQLKSNLRRSYDLELNLSGHRNLEPDDLHGLLDNLKLLHVSIQSIEIQRELHAGAFANLLQPRQIGLTLEVSEPREPLNGLRTHWKIST
ncbi:MAG: hypothetical protein FJW36_06850 [Acidobacteria bacterium]|nr:hypothetical protein [Acidobacteriota bacterium]